MRAFLGVFLRWSLLAGGLAWETGCSRLDLRAPPLRGPFGGRSEKNPMVDESTDERDALFAKLAGEVARQRTSNPGDYVVGPGDEVQVSIFALENPDSTTVVKRVIPREETINLPWIEDIRTTGCSVRELERRIAKAYAGRYIKNPQVSVEVTQFRSHMVVITGAVRTPGVYPMTDNQSTLIEMLSKAGGLLPDASDEILVVRAPPEEHQSPQREKTPASTSAKKTPAKEAVAPPAEPQTLTVSLQRLLNQGDLRENIPIFPGDVLTVRTEKAGYFYVLGYVSRPGVYTLRSGQNIDPVRAVAMAGGLSPIARPEHSYIVRTTPSGQKVIPVNIVKMAHGYKKPEPLESGDTLVVGSTFFSRLMEIVRPSVGMGMSYSPLP